MTEVRQPRRTNKELQAALAEENVVHERFMKQRDEARIRADQAEARVKEVTTQFGDLKQRLLAAEQSNQFMRGYLQRVAEDDVVREELVQTGDPSGETRLVPKRRPTNFPSPNDFTTPQSDCDSFGYMSRDDERHKPKHWITYG